MDYKYCKRCKKLYTFNGNKLCQDCIRELDDIVVEIKNYLADNPVANVMKICKELEVDEKDILYLMREQRIELTQIDVSKLGFACASCGEPTLGEKYCKNCKEKMSEEMLGATQAIKGRMSEKGKKVISVVNTLHNDDR